MENWKYFFVSSLVLLCCLRDAKSEKSNNEIDKTKWTPKLRDPVKVKYYIKSGSSKFQLKMSDCCLKLQTKSFLYSPKQPA